MFLFIMDQCRLVKHLLSLSGEGEGSGKTIIFLTNRRLHHVLQPLK